MGLPDWESLLKHFSNRISDDPFKFIGMKRMILPLSEEIFRSNSTLVGFLIQLLGPMKSG